MEEAVFSTEEEVFVAVHQRGQARIPIGVVVNYEGTLASPLRGSGVCQRTLLVVQCLVGVSCVFVIRIGEVFFIDIVKIRANRRRHAKSRAQASFHRLDLLAFQVFLVDATTYGRIIAAMRRVSSIFGGSLWRFGPIVNAHDSKRTNES